MSKEQSGLRISDVRQSFSDIRVMTERGCFLCRMCMNIGESILIITDRYREKTGYCSLVIFREVFFVSEDHRKP